MAQAYTAPDWASGEGISPSNLQSISNVLEGIVQGTDRAIHGLDINGNVLTVTYVDGSIENFTVAGLKGIADVSKTRSGNVDTYTITYTDGTTYSFEVINGGGGGTDVQWKQETTEGTKIAEITIDGETTEVFAPTGGGGGSSMKIEKVFEGFLYTTSQSFVTTEIPSIEGYDALLIYGSYHNNGMWEAINEPQFILKQDYLKYATYTNEEDYTWRLSGSTSTIRWIPFRFIDYTHIRYMTPNGNSAIKTIYGINFGSGGSGGTSDYNSLFNQPKINGVTLTGNKTAEDLELATASAVNALADIVGTVNAMLEGV